MMEHEGDDFEFVVERLREEPGKSFSGDAMAALVNEVSAFLGTRIMRRWEATNEPPSFVRVTMHVDVG